MSKTNFNNPSVITQEEINGLFTADEATHLIDIGKDVATRHNDYLLNGPTGERFIYQYFTEWSKTKLAAQGKIIFKIGGTSVDVATRVAQQGDAASFERKYIADYWVINKIVDDKELHRELIRGGVEQITDGDGTEWFAIPANNIMEGVEYVRDVIERMEKGTVGKVFKFRTLQLRHFNMANQFIRKHQGEANILANLPPRYGKTPSALQLFLLMAEVRGHHTLALPSHFLSTISSIKKDIKKFKCFNHIEFIDMAAQGSKRLTAEEAEDLYKEYRAAGKMVAIGISMYGEDENFEARYEWVSKLDKNYVTTIADEADWGLHTTNALYKMDFLLTGNSAGRDNHVRIHMSGTNVQRVAKSLGINIQLVLSASYAEVYNSDPTEYIKRHHYQLHAPAFFAKLNTAKKSDLMSHRKLFADAKANRETLKQLALSFTGRLTINDEFGLPKKVKTFDLSHITDDDITCFMVTMNATNDNMNLVRDYWQEALTDDQLGSWKVIALNGAAGYTNREAEELIETEIIKAQNEGYVGFIIIANMMGSRSFSIGQIQGVLNMKDRGSIDTMEQIKSRDLTPGILYNVDPAKRIVKTNGYTWDMALDGNREENIAELIIEEIEKIKRSAPGTTNEEAKRQVLEAYDFMLVSDLGGTMKMTGDELNKILTAPETLERIADVSVDPDAIVDSGLLVELIGVISTSNTKDKKAALKAAEVFANKPKKGDVVNRKDADIRAMEKLITGAIRTINRSARAIARLTTGIRTADTFRACLEVIAADEDLADEFEMAMVGVEPKVILELLDVEGALNETILNALVELVQSEVGQAHEDFVNF